MRVGPYSFEEFKAMAAQFHGYPAPGVLIGGYMAGAAKAHIPEGVLFEVVVETKKCLPDAVQLLTPCTTGNNWLRIVDLGRYALSMYDKHTGEGVRVAIDPARLRDWPEIQGWFLRTTPKVNQDFARLLREIETAGDSILAVAVVQMRAEYLGKPSTSRIGVCPVCCEAYPETAGAICKGCQGEAPYVPALDEREQEAPLLSTMPVARAVGRRALHDMTEIVPGVSKLAAVEAGKEISNGDVCRLQRMGRNRIYVEKDAGPGWVHENEAAKVFAERIAGTGVVYRNPPKEGKIEFLAKYDGLLNVEVEQLRLFNLCPDVMLATRHNNSLVEAGEGLGGCRAIPLYISRKLFSQAITVLGDKPVLSVLPLRKASAGVLVTGTEVFEGLIEDRFLDVVAAKLGRFGGTVVDSRIAPDDVQTITEAAKELTAQGIDLLVITGGMSVDPEDVTRRALLSMGLQNVLYGAPVLPGAMMLVGLLGDVQVLGVPACALYHRTTGFDILLPRLLAGRNITRKDLALMAEGGFCLGCQNCVFPKCSFGKV